MQFNVNAQDRWAFVLGIDIKLLSITQRDGGSVNYLHAVTGGAGHISSTGLDCRPCPSTYTPTSKIHNNKTNYEKFRKFKIMM